MRFSKKCHELLFSGFFGTLLTNYSASRSRFESGIFGGKGSRELPRKWSDSPVSRARRVVIVKTEQSRILSALSGSGRWLLSCSLKFYGFLFMYFGFAVILVELAKNFTALGRIGMIDATVGAISIAAALPMFFSSKSLAQALDDSIFVSFVSRKLTGVESRAAGAAKPDFGSKRYFTAALIGSLLGCASYYIAPTLIIAGIAAIIALFMIYARPDVGLMLAVFVTPFMSFLPSPSILLALMVLYITLCTLIRAFLGRIALGFEITDFFVALFMLIMLMGGVISVGGIASLREAAIYVSFMLVYFLTVTLISSPERLERLKLAFTSGAVLTALYGLYQKASGNMELGTMDKEMFSDIDGRVASTFENSNMLGVFLIMAIPFALSYLFSVKGLAKKLIALGACGVLGLCLIYTWSRGAWLGLIFSCVVFMIIYSHRILPIAIPAGLLGVSVFGEKLLSGGSLERLITRFSSIITMSDTSSVYRLGIWRGALGIINKYWLTGIGVGAEAFSSVYIMYAESGIESAVHSHNLFLQVLIETGISGFAVFIILLVLALKSGLEVVKLSTEDTKREKATSAAAVCALLAALVQSMTDFIWFNYRIFFVFWFVIAVISASSRIARKKRDVTDIY